MSTGFKNSPKQEKYEQHLQIKQTYNNQIFQNHSPNIIDRFPEFAQHLVAAAHEKVASFSQKRRRFKHPLRLSLTSFAAAAVDSTVDKSSRQEFMFFSATWIRFSISIRWPLLRLLGYGFPPDCLPELTRPVLQPFPAIASSVLASLYEAE
ncbi:hypothetical protein C2S51_026180 [Perilla frutescens var. frutescens]|nr:hypothetical protein C2S51_026180 [Perilla frutescens var. frutescens]